MQFYTNSVLASGEKLTGKVFFLGQMKENCYIIFAEKIIL